MGGRELTYIHSAFDENWVAPLGPHVNAFEQNLAKYCQTPYAVALSSGTAAIHLGLIALGVGKGDIVICQSKTFSASANPIIYQGATPIFVDSEKETWNICPNGLEESLKKLKSEGDLEKVKAILVVHLYGMPANMKSIIDIAEKYGIPVLEDAAEALGSTYYGQPCGSFGKIGVLSFNGNKIITTSGGGALLTSDARIAESTVHLSTQARDAAPHYEHTKIGYNYRLSNICAGIGLGQLEVLGDRILKRRANFERYKEYFNQQNGRGYSVQFQNEDEHSFSNRWLTCILVNPEENNGLTREDIRLKLLEDNIEARPLWKPMHLQPVFEGCRYVGGNVSEVLFDQGLCLPSGSLLSEEEFDRIFRKLDEAFN
ncbi:MAG: DegT/DnrJ/EryC1/StrS family aminotransferase [Chitinophagaceae bacterium]|nr:DegT/DnrJ/EryC1/StrS family aminotransferase [Chitinophagaceae bacterium]